MPVAINYSPGIVGNTVINSHIAALVGPNMCPSDDQSQSAVSLLVSVDDMLSHASVDYVDSSRLNMKVFCCNLATDVARSKELIAISI